VALQACWPSTRRPWASIDRSAGSCGEVVSGSLITAATAVGADPPIGVSKADKDTLIIERQGQQVRS